MVKFTNNTNYYTRSIGDHNCVFTIKVISRTEKSAKIIDFYGNERRAKIYSDNGTEHIQPEHYSMAPLFRAENTKRPVCDWEK